MNADRIDMQVLSDSNSMQSAPVDSAVELARAVNDRLADAVAKHPDRFATFSTLPWQDPDDAVRELERTVSDLGLTATMLLGHPGEDVFLDDPRYAQVLASNCRSPSTSILGRLSPKCSGLITAASTRR
jgi:predicted TIM-barrel fold metal-dependent hydrolase